VGRNPAVPLAAPGTCKGAGSQRKVFIKCLSDFPSGTGMCRVTLLPVIVLLGSSFIHDSTLQLAASAEMWVFNSLQVQHWFQFGKQPEVPPREANPGGAHTHRPVACIFMSCLRRSGFQDAEPERICVFCWLTHPRSASYLQADLAWFALSLMKWPGVAGRQRARVWATA